MKKKYTIRYENRTGESIEFKFSFSDDKEALRFGKIWLSSYVVSLSGCGWVYNIINPAGKNILCGSGD